jgi:hypothetical protein
MFLVGENNCLDVLTRYMDSFFHFSGVIIIFSNFSLVLNFFVTFLFQDKKVNIDNKEMNYARRILVN